MDVVTLLALALLLGRKWIGTPEPAPAAAAPKPKPPASPATSPAMAPAPKAPVAAKPTAWPVPGFIVDKKGRPQLVPGFATDASQAEAAAAPPFPGGWEAAVPPEPSVTQRATQLLSSLWASGKAGATKLEKLGGKLVMFQAYSPAKGKKSVVAYRVKGSRAA